MKITEDEREAAYELRWMIEQILFERERAGLYRTVLRHSLSSGSDVQMAVQAARDGDREHGESFRTGLQAMPRRGRPWQCASQSELTKLLLKECIGAYLRSITIWSISWRSFAWISSQIGATLKPKSVHWRRSLVIASA